MWTNLADLMRSQVMPWLRKWIFDWLIKKVLGSTVGGFKGFLAKWLFGKLWDKIIKPLFLKGLRKATTAINRYKYKRKAKELNDADTKSEFDSATDDLP